jgi:Kef-type K+ transport system membrane component KefB
MHYLLKPLVRTMRHMNDRELKLSIILGIVLFIAGLLDLLAKSTI